MQVNVWRAQAALLMIVAGCAEPVERTGQGSATLFTSSATADDESGSDDEGGDGEVGSGEEAGTDGDDSSADETGDTGAGTDTGWETTAGDGGCYGEPVDPDADLTDLENGYTPSKWKETVFGVLERRWPAGYDLLFMEQNDPYFGAFADTSSFVSLMDSLMTEVHESTHGWDYGHASVNEFAYYLRADLTFHPPKTAGFPRSELYGMLTDDSTDLYASTYLVGEQGTRGFYELLDEMNCYINGLAGITFVGEYIPWGISARDGAVAFLYYLELYLKRARTSYPALYQELESNPEYVEMVEVQWLRTHFFLEYSDTFPGLGIYDGAIREHLYDPSNMSEIEMFIGKPVDASSCLP